MRMEKEPVYVMVENKNEKGENYTAILKCKIAKDEIMYYEFAHGKRDDNLGYSEKIFTEGD